MSFYSRVLRPALFALDAERAHDLTMAAVRQPLVVDTLRRTRTAASDERLAHDVFGIHFPNPLGLAAGLDKQGTAVPAWAAIGFGFAEIGTITPRPQPGNPKPRLFRLLADRAIINRFGFNSAGAARLAEHLSTDQPPGTLSASMRIGINIGKNRDTPNEQAADDYVDVVDALHPYADYFAINVSSPNTQGLRELQEERALRTLVEQVVRRVAALESGRTIPVLVKISPDGDPRDLCRSVEAAVEGGARGVIATNTTTARPPLRDAAAAGEAGGLSGAPLRETANAVCRRLFQHFGKSVPVVGVGGIFTADDAYARVRAGARLIQIYTALIYEGPGVVQRILAGLAERLHHDGFSRLEDAVGVDTYQRTP